MIAYCYNQSAPGGTRECGIQAISDLPTVQWESFPRHAQATFNFGQPRSESRGKECTKTDFYRANRTSLTDAATFGDEGKLGHARVEVINHKVFDGQLVDLGPAPTRTSMPSSFRYYRYS
jgi:hypothetical protein